MIQQTHPHPRIAPHGKTIVFSSDRSGYENICSVEIADFESLPLAEQTRIIPMRSPPRWRDPFRLVELVLLEKHSCISKQRHFIVSAACSVTLPSALGTKAMQKAFTLIELLVTIAIIAVLVALTSAAWSSTRKRSLQIQCVQNLKSVGLAINLYTADHDATLPGPTFWSQKSMPDDGRFLAAYLGPYLGYNISLTPGQLTKVDTFRCPCATWAELSYIACQQIKGGTIPNKSLWGDVTTGVAAENLMPVRVAMLTSLGIKLSSQWAIRDSYGTAPADNPGLGMKGPSRHGKTSVLFFDGHAAAE